MYQVFFKALDEKGNNKQMSCTRSTRTAAEFAAHCITIDKGYTNCQIVQVRQLCGNLNVNEDHYRAL